MTSSFASAASRRHAIPLWVLVGSVLLVVSAWSAWDVYIDYQQTMEQEYRLLEVRARQHEARIAGALRSVDLMLGSIIGELTEHPAMPVAEQNQLLKQYLRQLPEIDNLLVTDASGHIRADTYEKIIGIDVAHREYFRVHRDAPNIDDFHISAPFKTVIGRIATTQSRVIRDRQGRFEGVIAATLDAKFFAATLTTLAESQPSVQAVLINLNGDILNLVPATDAIGKSIRGGIAFTEHINSGQVMTRHLNVNKLEPVVKMSVFHNLPNMPLAVISSRDYDQVMAEWRHSLYVHLGGFLLLTATALFFAWLAAQRNRSLLAAQQLITERELELRTIIETEPECVKQLAADGTLLQMNRAGLNMIEAESLDQVQGQNVLQLVMPEYRDAFAALNRRVFLGESGELVFEVQGLKGGRRWLETHAVPLRNSQGEVTALLGLTRDITERKQMEDQVRQLAFHDPLTQLPNRRLLNDRLNQAMAASKRNACYGALIFLDLDNFKPLNDTHGHEVGDLLLIEAAARLKRCVREMDTVARFGGDEFVIVVSKLDAGQAESAEQARVIAEKIRATLSEPYLLKRQQEDKTDMSIEHSCTASIGVALFINHEASQADIIKWADTAMYQAKEEGRNAIRFFDPAARSSG